MVRSIRAGWLPRARSSGRGSGVRPQAGGWLLLSRPRRDGRRQPLRAGGRGVHEQSEAAARRAGLRFKVEVRVKQGWFWCCPLRGPHPTAAQTPRMVGVSLVQDLRHLRCLNADQRAQLQGWLREEETRNMRPREPSESSPTTASSHAPDVKTPPTDLGRWCDARSCRAHGAAGSQCSPASARFEAKNSAGTRRHARPLAASAPPPQTAIRR